MEVEIMIVNGKEISVGDRIKFKQHDRQRIGRVRVVGGVFVEILHKGNKEHYVYEDEIIEVYNSKI